MSEVRALPIGDLEEYVRILADAYPGLEIVTAEDRERVRQRMARTYDDPTRCMFGTYRDDELLGVMVLYDFQMKLLSVMAPAGGVGQVAVDLLHKKEHVAKEMMGYFLEHFRRRNASMVMLYPFRSDFYRQMGFGYGPKIHHYRLNPAALPRGDSKTPVRFLDNGDREAVSACYARRLSITSGMVVKSDWELDRFFESPAVRIVGYEVDGRLNGYMAFTFIRGDSFLDNDLRVLELIYDDRHALLALLTFLSTQADQIGRIAINTFDETFHYLLSDPRNDSGNTIRPVYLESNVQGTGLMYRVIDTPALFQTLSSHNFRGQNCRLRLTLEDDFLPANSGSVDLHFVDGRPLLDPESVPEVEVCMKIAEFSSMLMGLVRFEDLWTYGLADMSDSGYVEVVDAIFRTDRKPVCLTQF
jgi:predicted acetyltransferase